MEDKCTAIYSLIGSLINENVEEIFVTKFVLFAFKIFFGSTVVQLFAIKKEEKAKWVKALKAAVGYSNLSDFYDLKVFFLASIRNVT